MALKLTKQTNADLRAFEGEKKLIETLEFAAWFIQQNCEGGAADRATQNIATVIKAAQR